MRIRRGPSRYEVVVQGHFGPQWSRWFEGMELTARPDGCTAMTGPLPDQPALHAVLQRISELGLTLVSVRRINGPEREA